jgi:hypothetical protein
MSSGTPVNRQWVIVLKDGTVCVDWGDALFQDVASGEFIAVNEHDFSHNILDEELEWLVRISRVSSFSRQVVHFHNLPERPIKTIE